jgi:hypothetical protein
MRVTFICTPECIADDSPLRRSLQNSFREKKRKKKTLTMKLLYLCVVLLILSSKTMASERDWFASMWEQMNRVLCEGWEQWREDAFPREILLLEVPGFTVDWSQFDSSRFRRAEYNITSPSYRQFLLADVAPSFSPYFVDSGFRISKLYAQMTLNFLTSSALDNPQRLAHLDAAYRALADEILARQKALLQVEQALDDAEEEQQGDQEEANLLGSLFSDDTDKEDTTSSGDDTLALSYTLLAAWKRSVAELYAEKRACLLDKNVDVDECMRRAVTWKADVDERWWNYDQHSKSSRLAQSLVQSSVRQSLHSHMAMAMRDLMLGSRREVGASLFLASYATTRFVPDDWWRWFSTDNAGREARANTDAFRRITLRPSNVPPASTSAFERMFGSNSSAPMATNSSSVPPPLIRIASPSSADDDGQSLNASDELADLSITFDVAAVAIERPWFSDELLRMRPLAIEGLEEAAWSRGGARGSSREMLPFLPTAMIVARNIVIQSSQWSPALVAALEQASGTAPTLSIQIGPFIAGASTNRLASAADNQVESRSPPSSFDAADGSLRIVGPLIIGWRCRRTPRFPNSNADAIARESAQLRASNGTIDFIFDTYGDADANATLPLTTRSAASRRRYAAPLDDERHCAATSAAAASGGHYWRAAHADSERTRPSRHALGKKVARAHQAVDDARRERRRRSDLARRALHKRSTHKLRDQDLARTPRPPADFDLHLHSPFYRYFSEQGDADDDIDMMADYPLSFMSPHHRHRHHRRRLPTR